MMRWLAMLLPLLISAPAHACTSIGGGWTSGDIHTAVIINEPGRYCLEETMQVLLPGMNGITITADDVLLDLGGSAILGPKTGSGVGVQVLGANVTVNGGNISGFRYGAWAYNNGVYLSRIDASGNIAGGIKVVGEGAIVENSRVSGMIAGDAEHRVGISVSGGNCHVRYNMVTDAFSPANRQPGVGLSVSGDGCLIYQNVSAFSASAPVGSVALKIGAAPPSSVYQNIVVPDAGL